MLHPDIALDATSLRQELKSWEKSFAAANGGRKPGRVDIKNDASISAKYREYDLLRRSSAGPHAIETPRKVARLRPASAHKRTALRERSGNAISATPQKSRSVETLEVGKEEPILEPTPAFIRCALGPTPQKDGQVLGIFDMVSCATPSRSTLLPTIAEMPAIAGTPSKSAAPPSSEPTLSRTPQSSGKRRYLEAFEGTPVKRRREDDVQTPSRVKKLFATPSFLRRSFPLASVAEDDANAGGMGPPLKKRGLFRSLSSMIQGLRKEEEKRMDDEWDIMNELEAEERGEFARPEKPQVLVEDSQAIEMPLGPDEAPEESEDDATGGAEALDASGKPRKLWKKKGLKRQTRRTVMRPVLHKPKKAADAIEHGEGVDGADDVVAESQVVTKPAWSIQSRSAKADSDASDGDWGGSEDGDEGHDAAATEAKAASKKKKKAAEPEDKAKSDDGPRMKPGTTKKKVSAQAHANFRKLKIKNKNSKANGRGRFGRR